MITEKQFWQIVKELDWPKSCKSEKTKIHNILAVVSKYSQDVLDDFIQELGSKHEDLIIAIHKEEEKRGCALNLSDDGFEYFVYHIIGCGQKAYTQALKSWDALLKRLVKKDYVEGFCYMTHFDQFKDELNPQYYIDWAAKAFGELTRDLGNLPNVEDLDPDVAEKALEALVQVAQGDFSDPKFIKFKNKDWYSDLGRKVAGYSIPNLFNDLRKYRDFFKVADLTNVNKINLVYNKVDRNAIIAELEDRLDHRLQTDSFARRKIIMEGFVPYHKLNNQQLINEINNKRKM